MFFLASKQSDIPHLKGATAAAATKRAKKIFEAGFDIFAAPTIFVLYSPRRIGRERRDRGWGKTRLTVA